MKKYRIIGVIYDGSEWTHTDIDEVIESDKTKEEIEKEYKDRADFFDNVYIHSITEIKD